MNRSQINLIITETFDDPLELSLEQNKKFLKFSKLMDKI